ncbi:hypothetical protein D3C73_1651650 [compost metagenome]
MVHCFLLLIGGNMPMLYNLPFIGAEYIGLTFLHGKMITEAAKNARFPGRLQADSRDV